MSRLAHDAAFVTGRILCRQVYLLEAKIAKNKDLYYDALAQAQTGWHEGTEDVVPFIKYLLGTILAAYKDFEDRVALGKPSCLHWKWCAEQARIESGRFNKQDIGNSAQRSATVP